METGFQTVGFAQWIQTPERAEELVRQETKRCRLLEILGRPAPIWNSGDHPEIEAQGGSAAWVKRMRREAEEAFEKRTRTENTERDE
jgi:hypothetical protein